MKRAIVSVLILVFFSVILFSEESDLICGKWLTENDKSVVEIYKKDQNYYGKIIWLKESTDENGKATTDTKNPKEGLRNKPLVNLVILSNLAYQGKNKWSGGKIYDPKNGKTYDVKLALSSKDRIELRGFIGVSLIGRTSYWTRVERK